MSYLLQSIIYTGLMLAIYMLLLRNRPAHAFNRAYLIASVIVPIVLPLLHLPELLHTKFTVTNNVSKVLPAIIAGGHTTVNITVPQTTGINLLWTAYWLIATVALAILLHGVVKILYTVKRNRKEKHDGYTLVYDTGIGPGSWGQYILLPERKADATVLKHELAHIRMGHTADLLLLSLLQCVLWVNPFLYIIKRELKQVHEFQADAKACNNEEEYSKLLLASVFNTCDLSLTHSFIVHPIKRRIMMLHKNGQHKGRFAAIIFAIVCALAALTGTILLQSCNKAGKDMGHVEKITDLSKQPSYSNAVEWNEFISQNLKYPKEAQKAGKEGRVMVKFTVDEKGNVVNPRIVSSDDTLFSLAALQVMGHAPKWTPGEKKGKKVPVDMYQPFLFSLGKEGQTKSTQIVMYDPKSNVDDAIALTDGKSTKTTTLEIPQDKLEEYKKAQKKIQDAEKIVAAKQAEIDKAQAHLNAMQAETDKAAAEAKQKAEQAKKKQDVIH